LIAGVAQHGGGAAVDRALVGHHIPFPQTEIGPVERQFDFFRRRGLLLLARRGQIFQHLAPPLHQHQAAAGGQAEHQPGHATGPGHAVPAGRDQRLVAAQADHQRLVQPQAAQHHGALDHQPLFAARRGAIKHRFGAVAVLVAHEEGIGRGAGIAHGGGIGRHEQDAPATVFGDGAVHVRRIQGRAHDGVEVLGIEDGADGAVVLAVRSHQRHRQLDVEDARRVFIGLGQVQRVRVVHVFHAARVVAVVQAAVAQVVVGHNDVALAVQHQQGTHAGHGALERLQQRAAAIGGAVAAAAQRVAHAVQRTAHAFQLVAEVFVNDQRLQPHALDIGGQQQATFIPHEVGDQQATEHQHEGQHHPLDGAGAQTGQLLVALNEHISSLIEHGPI
ncbi:conserved hypothetical protein, partial [Ricinus communis]